MMIGLIGCETSVVKAKNEMKSTNTVQIGRLYFHFWIINGDAMFVFFFNFQYLIIGSLSKPFPRIYVQVHTAVQQPGFKRVKRGLRPAIPAIHGLPFESTFGAKPIGLEPSDPYFPLQWYLKNTGQNGGKMRLDLNVQAAWDQGITGKNVTTAIMDDGECRQQTKTGFFI